MAEHHCTLLQHWVICKWRELYCQKMALNVLSKTILAALHFAMLKEGVTMISSKPSRTGRKAPVMRAIRFQLLLHKARL